MKLLKPPGQDTWHVEITTEDGSKKTIDTECLTKKEAESVVAKAKLKELELASKSHRLTSEVVTLITANRSVTVTEAINEWDEWMKTATRSDRTRTNNLIAAKQWAREMDIEAKTIGSIGTDQIHQWINKADDDTKRGTRLLKLSAVRNLLRFCTIKRYVLSDPSQLVAVDHRIMSHTQKQTKHKPVFSDDEIDFVLAKCEGAEPPMLTPGFFKAGIILGRDLGLRLGDICNLEWGTFNIQKRTVSVWSSKPNAWVEVPMPKRVLRLITMLSQTHRQYVFPKEREIANNPALRSTISMAFSRFFARIGFDGYTFHSLRASLATTLANRGATMDDIAEALGQKGTGATPAYIRKPTAAKVNLR